MKTRLKAVAGISPNIGGRSFRHVCQSGFGVRLITAVSYVNLSKHGSLDETNIQCVPQKSTLYRKYPIVIRVLFWGDTLYSVYKKKYSLSNLNQA